LRFLPVTVQFKDKIPVAAQSDAKRREISSPSKTAVVFGELLLKPRLEVGICLGSGFTSGKGRLYEHQEESLREHALPTFA
jgi:hypothetical protein